MKLIAAALVDSVVITFGDSNWSLQLRIPII
jgi:hypothetical protein